MNHRFLYKLFLQTQLPRRPRAMGTLMGRLMGRRARWADAIGIQTGRLLNNPASLLPGLFT